MHENERSEPALILFLICYIQRRNKYIKYFVRAIGLDILSVQNEIFWFISTDKFPNMPI